MRDVFDVITSVQLHISIAQLSIRAKLVIGATKSGTGDFTRNSI